MMYPRKTRNGMTLVEVICVACILIFLSALLIGNCQGGCGPSANNNLNRYLLNTIHGALEISNAEKGLYPPSAWQEFDPGSLDKDQGYYSYKTTYEAFSESHRNKLGVHLLNKILDESDLPDDSHISSDKQSILDAYGNPFVYINHPRVPLGDNNKDGTIDNYDCVFNGIKHDDIRSFYLPFERKNIAVICAGPDGLFNELNSSDYNADNLIIESDH